MITAAREGLLRLHGILEVAGHAIVATHQHLTERLAVSGDLVALVVDHSDGLGHHVVNTLAGEALGVPSRSGTPR